jgi:hypothetical protein
MKSTREYTGYLQDILEATSMKIYLPYRLPLRKYSKILKKVIIDKCEPVPNYVCFFT